MLIFLTRKEEDPGSYRPVSVTLNPGKLMEQILLEVICKHIKDEMMIRSSRHGFTKWKACLAKPVASYGGMTSSLDRGGAFGIYYLFNFRMAFDTVSVTAL